MNIGLSSSFLNTSTPFSSRVLHQGTSGSVPTNESASVVTPSGADGTADRNLSELSQVPQGAALSKDQQEGRQDDEKDRAEREQEARIEQQERLEIRDLAARDREVRAHEQAHAAVGGQYAGAPQYDFKRGPDGLMYAVGGEVSIDVSEASTPQETIQKMQVVRRAALAPAEPSPQDRRVAAEASVKETEARHDLAVENREQLESSDAVESEKESSGVESGSEKTASTASAQNVPVVVPEAIAPLSIANRLHSAISSSQPNDVLGHLINQRA